MLRGARRIAACGQKEQEKRERSTVGGAEKRISDRIPVLGKALPVASGPIAIQLQRHSRVTIRG